MPMVSLHPEQQYVWDISESLDITPILMYHQTPTNTCFEKADLLNWHSEQVIKAVYFRREQHVVGVIIPELGGNIAIKEIFSSVLNISKKEAKEYRIKNPPPTGMEMGTCSPFPLETSMGNEIHKIIIYNKPSLEETVVDISIGGIGMEAHQSSMHLPYSSLFTILKEKFNGHIHQYSPKLSQ